MENTIENLKFLKIKIEKHPTKNTTLEFIEKPNAIAALILNHDESKVLLVEQYRPGARKKLLEIPAGIIENGELPFSTLKRELREETGYEFKSFELIYAPEKSLILSPGYTSEELYIYILKLKSENEKIHELELDDGEDLICHWIDIKKIEAITNDFKTLYSFNLYKLFSK